MNKIKWKYYPIEAIHDDQTLKGSIMYWAKDWKVILTQPVKAESSILHMMYMIPVRFVTPLDTDNIKNVKDVDIVDDGVKKLKKIFEIEYYKLR